MLFDRHEYDNAVARKLKSLDSLPWWWGPVVALGCAFTPWAIRTYRRNDVGLPELIDIVVAVVVLVGFEAYRRNRSRWNAAYALYCETATKHGELARELENSKKLMAAKPKTFVLTAPDVPPHYGVNRQLCLHSGDDRDVDGVQVWLTELTPKVEGFLPSVLLRPQDKLGTDAEHKFKLNGAVPKMIGVFGTFPSRPHIFRLFTLAEEMARDIPALPSHKRYRAGLTVTGNDATPLNSVAEFGVDEEGEPVIDVKNA